MKAEHGLEQSATDADLKESSSITTKEVQTLTVPNVDHLTLPTVDKPSKNRRIADAIAKKYNGSVIGAIQGNKGRAGYIVQIEDCKIHVYLINVWHNNRKAISINTEQLQKALDDDALILMSYRSSELVAHSKNWEYWARVDDNYAVHTKYGTNEVFCRTDNFRFLDLDKHKIQDYYPD